MIPSRSRSLDPTQQAWFDQNRVDLPDGAMPTPQQMRDGFRHQMSLIDTGVDTALTVVDHTIAGGDGQPLAIRHYRLDDDAADRPACLYVHGGGWVVGDLDTHDSVCSDLATGVGIDVIAVDYRLAPEHPFPAALDDTLAAFAAVTTDPETYGIDPGRVVLMGDSAGGSLAAAAALSLCEGKLTRPAALVLLYPALGADMDRASFTDNADIPGLSAREMRYFFTRYVGGETLPDPLAAPLTVADVSALPTTFLCVGELDPLRDDSVDFATRLHGAGVPVQCRVEPGLAHAWLWVRHTSHTASLAFRATLDFLHAALHDAVDSPLD